MLSNKIYLLIRHLLDDSSEEVLTFDDSLYDRSRSKKVELLSRVFDHNTKKYLKSFRVLTLGWTDGNSFPGMVIARYNLLAWFQCQQVDQRSFGDLFRFCNEGIENIKFIDALKVIMQMAMAAIHKTKAVSENIIQTIMNAVIRSAIIFFGLDSNKSSLISEG